MDYFINKDIVSYISQLQANDSRYLIEHLKKSYDENSFHMQVSLLQASFLKFICRVKNPNIILELGTFLGFSSIAMAESIKDESLIYTCDKSSNNLSKAIEYHSNHKDFYKIRYCNEDCFTFLDKFKNVTDVDLIFIDADKSNYIKYYDIAKSILSKKGIIIIDNTLWKGRLINLNNDDLMSEHINKFNNYIRNDHSVFFNILPIGDGFTVVSLK